MKIVNKIVRYSISFGVGFLGLLILATVLHKIEATPGGIIGNETQIQFINPSTGFIVYVVALIMIFVSSVLGRKTVGDPITALVSWVIAVFRIIGSLALISGGACIYIFENKLFQYFQLFLPILVIGIQYSLSSARRDD